MRTGFASALLAAMLAAVPAAAADPKAVKAGDTLAGTAQVIDGDTIRLADAAGTRHRVRLFGVDAPEMAVWPWGPWARAALDRLAGGRHVVCRVRTIDRYTRPVAVCSADGPAGPVDLAEQLIADGFAIEYRTYSDGRYAEAERAAQQHRRGVFAVWPGR